MIVDYKDSWPRHFQEVRAVLADELDDDVHSIEHVGSTAIPEVPGRPIVDVHLGVPDREAMERVIDRLAGLGYVHEGDRGVPGRETFRRKGPDVPLTTPKRDWYPHHLYALLTGTPEMERHLVFRDHLRADAEDREAYIRLKRRLVEEHGSDREAYEAGKEEFIEKILEKAGQP